MKNRILLLGLISLILCPACQKNDDTSSDTTVTMSQHSYRILLDVPQTSKLFHWSNAYSSIISRGDDAYEIIFSHYMWYPFSNGPKFWESKGIEKKYNGENGKCFDCTITKNGENKIISTTIYEFKFKGNYSEKDLILETGEGEFEDIYTLHLTKLSECEYDSSLDDLYKEAMGLN